MHHELTGDEIPVHRPERWFCLKRKASLFLVALAVVVSLAVLIYRLW